MTEENNTDRCDVAKGIIGKLLALMENQNFIDEYKSDPADFTRSAPLNFKNILLMQLNMMCSSTQNELDRFFEILTEEDTESRKDCTGNAFSLARRKIRHGALIGLNDELANLFYSTAEYSTWNGRRLVSVDGSGSQMPNGFACSAYFGENRKNDDQRTYTMGRIIDFYDPLNKISIKSELMPYSDSEREMAYRMLPSFGKNDLLLLDRGFLSFPLMQAFFLNNLEFCLRMPMTSKMVEDFVDSGMSEDIVMYDVSRKNVLEECRAKGLPVAPIRLRLVRIELEDGTVEVLATNLFDSTIFTPEVMKKLYHLRWPVEEGFKDKKAKAQLPNWSGLTPETCKQDFHAKVLTLNLVAVIAFGHEEEIKEKCAGRKFSYKINWMEALRKIRDRIIRLFQYDKLEETVHWLVAQFIKNLTPHRPGRKFPRKNSKRRVKFSMCYKNIS